MGGIELIELFDWETARWMTIVLGVVLIPAGIDHYRRSRRRRRQQQAQLPTPPKP